MHRRTLLASLPLLSLVPAAPHDAGQLRIAGTRAQAAALQARTGIPTTTTPLRGPALVDALSAGHIEAATLAPEALAAAVIRMGPRLDIIGGTARATLVSRTALPRPLRSAIAATLA